MKGVKHPANDVTINPSGNESIRDVIAATEMSRRTFLKTTLSASVLSAIGGVTMTGFMRSVAAAPVPPVNGFAGIGFESIPPKRGVNWPLSTPSPASSAAPTVFADAVEVPAGYKVEMLQAWGDPVVPGAPAWLPDASQDAAAQLLQYGMHNDGMHFFAFPQRGGGAGGLSSERGLLCVNHEYTHEEILHGAAGFTSPTPMSIAKARKSQAAHGITVMEVRKLNGKWGVNRNSPYNRRITANTPMRVAGPAAGNDLLKSKKFDITPAGSVENGINDGFTAYGTMNNCANGYTPWGTYLTCEENWNNYFAAPSNGANIQPGDVFDQKPIILQNGNRYGIASAATFYQWPQVDPRFNADTNPLEPNLYGYVVEIDPFNPSGTPVKRTALGRLKHESAQVAITQQDGALRVAYYMGDDERNEYIYKFVCTQPFNPQNRAANLNLLDSGTLYVAKFTATPGQNAGSFRGTWIPLTPDTDTVIANPAGGVYKLRELATFAAASDAEVQGRICVFTRQAADAVGATMMDRPEWTALRTYFDPGQASTGYPTYTAQRPLEVYCTLTNNNRRGGGNTTGNPPVPAASPSLSSNNPNGSTGAGSARPPVDVANPRSDNDYGHIIRWREDGNVVTATGFEWDIFVLCGDTLTTKVLTSNYQTANFIGADPASPDFNRQIYEGNIVDVPPGSADFGAPDGLWFDQFGRMWIQTDQEGNAAGDWLNIGANIMACADPNTREIRRFLTSPPNCEVTGVINTPDGKAMFVNIQHPGEGSAPEDPARYSNWPRSQWPTNSAGEPLAGVASPVPEGQRQQTRPRSSTLVITRLDGGVIGA
jgi:secreted PhoX family phosphatase